MHIFLKSAALSETSMCKITRRRYFQLPSFSNDFVAKVPSSFVNKLSLCSTSPKASATVYMTFTMAVHFAGYECARSATISMFTSKHLGFESPTALPLGVGCICPFSVLLLVVSLCSRIAYRNDCHAYY